jgi:hypothetical protein
MVRKFNFAVLFLTDCVSVPRILGANWTPGRWPMARVAVGALVFLLASSFLLAQSTSATSDPQALALAAKSMAALTSGTTITDVALTGNASWFAGSGAETATATLLAKGTSESRVALQLSVGTRSETRNALQGFPQGKWVNPNGATGAYAWHNCQTDAIWFFPALSSLANSSNSSFVFSYVGQESSNGLTVQHLRVYQVTPADPTITLQVQTLSPMDFYLDPVSLLPLAVEFNVHPDNDMNTAIRTQIRFANYQVVKGIRIPFHIQQLINGGLALDVVITNATLNSGLTDSQFSLQ